MSRVLGVSPVILALLIGLLLWGLLAGCAARPLAPLPAPAASPYAEAVATVAQLRQAVGQVELPCGRVTVTSTDAVVNPS